MQSADAIKPDQVPAHAVAAAAGVARAWASAAALAEAAAVGAASAVMGLAAAQMHPALEVGPSRAHALRAGATGIEDASSYEMWRLHGPRVCFMAD